MSSWAVDGDLLVERERQRVGEPGAELAGQGGDVVERRAAARTARPRAGGAVARLAQSSSRLVDLGAGRAVARERRRRSRPSVEPSTSMPYARSSRCVGEAERGVEPDGRGVGAVDEEHAVRDAACARASRARRRRARARGRCPGAGGRRRSRRSRRARPAPWAGRPGAPWSSRTRRGPSSSDGERGSPRDRTTARPRAGAGCRVSSRPAPGAPANARLFTASHASSSVPGTKVRTVDAVGPCGGSASGSGTRSWSRSRSGANPASANPVVVAGRRPCSHERDVTAALAARPRRARRARGRRARRRYPGRIASSSDHSSAGGCARCAYADWRRRRVADARAARGRRALPRPSANPIHVVSPNGGVPVACLDLVGERRGSASTTSGANCSSTRTSGMAVEGTGPSPSTLPLSSTVARRRSERHGGTHGDDEVRARSPVVGRPRCARHREGRGLLLGAVRLGVPARSRGGRRLPRVPARREARSPGSARSRTPARRCGRATSTSTTPTTITAAVTANGGQVFVPADGRHGPRAAWRIFADPVGAAFGVWQAGDAPRRRHRQRAGHVLVDRAHHHRRRRRRRRSTARCSGGAPRRTAKARAPTPSGRSTAARSAG